MPLEHWSGHNSVVAISMMAVSISFAFVFNAMYRSDATQNNTIVVTEFLEDERTVGLFSEPPYTINVIGHWDKDGAQKKLTVMVAQSDVANFEEMKGLVKHLLAGNKPTNDSQIDEREYYRWNDLLSSTQSDTKVPKLSFKESGQAYDILVKLTDEPHQNGKITAETTLNLDGKRIKSSEITIFNVNRVYDDGEFIAVLQHELGHAIGVGHSNYFNSIMYPSLVSINGELVGTISDCEAEGVKLAYSSLVDKTECMTQ